MPSTQVNVRFPSEVLKKIDERGKRSDIIKAAVEKYLSDETRIAVDSSLLAAKLDMILEQQKAIIDRLEEIKRFQPVININYPEGMLPQKQLPEKPGFWRRLFRRS
ncbi:MAG: hypothetical protein AB1485_00050 [Candidatus Thermoplasmatota archaeon]